MLGPSNLEYLILVIIAIFCGLGIRVSLGIAKQRWAMTYHHTMSYALLPPVTMIITTLISGNIALSLGMIGALSIVRFRNPVKNPFELVIFFCVNYYRDRNFSQCKIRSFDDSCSYLSNFICKNS